MNTQDLVPLLDEIQAHKENLVGVNRELEQARQACESLEQKSLHITMEIRDLYAVIQYSIDHDMDPTQAKLSMPSVKTPFPITNMLRGTHVTKLPTTFTTTLMEGAALSPVNNQKAHKTIMNKIFGVFGK